MRSTNFPDTSNDLQVAEKPPTRWDGTPAPTADDGDEERGGWFLAIVALILVPALVVAAVLLRTDPPTGRVDLATNPTTTEVQRGDESATNDSDAASVVDTDATSAVGSFGAAAVDSADDGDDVDVDVVVDPSVALGVRTEVKSVVEGSALGPVIDGTDIAVSPTTTPTIETAPTTPSDAAPTPAPTVVVVPVPIDRTPTTQPPFNQTTSTAPQTTTTAPQTTSAPTTTSAPALDLTALAARVEVGAIGDTFIRFRFTVAITTSYEAIVRTNTEVVSRVAATAIGGEPHDVSFDGLTPGTDYTIQVTLLGPPQFKSPPVAFRTSGGAAPPPADELVEFTEFAVVELNRTRFQINYASNICANGSFVIRNSAGTVVGRNRGQDEGCLRQHLAIPGFWTAALVPGETYRITLTLEANGQGNGDGNIRSRTATVTTLE